MADTTGFTSFDVTVDGVRIHGTTGGEGPPVLLLHGFPQSHVMWRPVMRDLAERHTVVATDLRGYGESDRPPSGEDHFGYSFRAMAADQAGVMAELGFERFAVVGHDRGARVTHRLALDHADRVEKLALLDILPTSYVYEHVDRALAQAYYHWFFFIQPAEVPERLIAGDPIYYLHRLLGSWGSGLAAHDAESLAAYEKAFADPEARHAMLEDYRAGATIDLEHDAEGATLGAPTLVLWGEKGVVGRNPEPPTEVWRRLAADPTLVTGQAVPDAGHFLVEENLPATVSALRDFLEP